MTLQAALQNGYWFLLGALVLFTAYRAYITTLLGSLPMIRTVLTMLIAGVLSLYLAGQMDWVSADYALSMMTADAIAAAVVLLYPAGRAQSVIGLTFLLQIGVYFARLLQGPTFDVNAYWWLLSILAFIQLFVAGGWIGHDVVSRWRAVSGIGRVSRPAHREGMG